MMQTQSESGRAEALERLKKKRELRAHLLAYVLINGSLAVVWAMAGASFFWPIFPILGWGVGIVLHAWDVLSRPPTEAQIERELASMQRLSRRDSS